MSYLGGGKVCLIWFYAIIGVCYSVLGSIFAFGMTVNEIYELYMTTVTIWAKGECYGW